MRRTRRTLPHPPPWRRLTRAVGSTDPDPKAAHSAAFFIYGPPPCACRGARMTQAQHLYRRRAWHYRSRDPGAAGCTPGRRARQPAARSGKGPGPQARHCERGRPGGALPAGCRRTRTGGADRERPHARRRRQHRAPDGPRLDLWLPGADPAAAGGDRSGQTGVQPRLLPDGFPGAGTAPARAGDPACRLPLERARVSGYSGGGRS